MNIRVGNEKEQLHKDDRGFSLVELVIAIAMSAIIMGAAGYFIVSAIRSFNSAAATIDLQQESQIFNEQLTKWTMESNYAEVYDTDAGTEVLVLYNIPYYIGDNKWPVATTHPAPATTGVIRIIWQVDNCLYTVTYGLLGASEFEFKPASGSVNYPLMPEPDAISAYVQAQAKPENLLCRYVEAFTPTTTIMNENPNLNVVDTSESETVNFDLKMKFGESEFSFSDQVLIRNNLSPYYKTLRTRFAGIR